MSTLPSSISCLNILTASSDHRVDTGLGCGLGCTPAVWRQCR